MKIGIIGGGSMGGTLTRRLAALGHDVSIANSRGPETLAELAAETGAVPVSITDAGRDADVMIIAIPEGNIPDLPEGLLESLPESGLVIDIGKLRSAAARRKDRRARKRRHRKPLGRSPAWSSGDQGLQQRPSAQPAEPRQASRHPRSRRAPSGWGRPKSEGCGDRPDRPTRLRRHRRRRP